MTEWELMTEIAQANNNGNDSQLAEIILGNDFSNKPRAVTIAISSFQLTKDNVSSYLDAAKKLADLPEPSSFRESFRQEMLKELISEIDSSVNKEEE